MYQYIYKNKPFLDLDSFKSNFSKKLKKEIVVLQNLMQRYKDTKGWFTLDFEPTLYQLVVLSQYGTLRNAYDFIDNKIIVQFKIYKKMSLEKVAQKDIFLSIAETMIPRDNQPVEKIGIDNLKKFVLFSFEFGKELIDFAKPRSERKSIAFEVLDLVPFVNDITNLPNTFKDVIYEVRDLDKDEIAQIANFISAKVPNINKITAEQQKRLILNLITVAFSVYEVSKDIIEITKK